MSCEKCDLPAAGRCARSTGCASASRGSSGSATRRSTRPVPGEAMALVRMTPAEHAESMVWVEINARESARKRQVA